MKDIEITKHREFEIATAKGEGSGFTVWAKKGKIITDCPIKEPGHPIFFNFGETREEARQKMIMEIDLIDQCSMEA